MFQAPTTPLKIHDLGGRRASKVNQNGSHKLTSNGKQNNANKYNNDPNMDSFFEPPIFKIDICSLPGVLLGPQGCSFVLAALSRPQQLPVKCIS